MVWSGPHLMHGFLSPPESTTQTASRSVQPFLQGSLLWQTNGPTDHATRSITIGHIYVCSTAMRPNNNSNNAYTGIIITQPLQEFTWFIGWMQTERQVAANPQIKPTDLGCKFTGRLLTSTSTSTIAIYYYSAHKLILILLSCARWKAE